MKRRILILTTGAICLLIAGLLATPAAKADVWDHKTTITVNQPFEVPGKVLPAGKYVMRIVDIADNRRVLRIYTADEMDVLATFMGIPDFRLKPNKDSDITFYEAPRGEPLPLHAWFYDGYQYGLEFVYPPRRAVEIADLTLQHVIAPKAEPVLETPGAEPSVKELLAEPLVAVEPGGGQVEIAAVHPEPAGIPAAPAIPATLPQTASGLPLLAFAGLLAGGVAAALRALRG